MHNIYNACTYMHSQVPGGSNSNISPRRLLVSVVEKLHDRTTVEACAAVQQQTQTQPTYTVCITGMLSPGMDPRAHSLVDCTDVTFLSPEAMILLVSTKDQDVWLAPSPNLL